MKQKLEEIKKLFETEIKQIKNSEQLENLKLKFMGKKGLITQVMPMLKDVANEQKRCNTVLGCNEPMPVSTGKVISINLALLSSACNFSSANLHI